MIIRFELSRQTHHRLSNLSTTRLKRECGYRIDNYKEPVRNPSSSSSSVSSSGSGGKSPFFLFFFFFFLGFLVLTFFTFVFLTLGYLTLGELASSSFLACFSAFSRAFSSLDLKILLKNGFFTVSSSVIFIAFVSPS